MLTALRDQGILTDEQFEIAKLKAGISNHFIMGISILDKKSNFSWNGYTMWDKISASGKVMVSMKVELVQVLKLIGSASWSH